MQLILDIWSSFRSMPLWVQIWVGLILAPVNMAALFYVGAPGGWLVAALAIGGMLPNLVLMAVERGLSKAMALSHLVLWIPLVFVILNLRGAEGVAGGFASYLLLLLVVDLISLGFDIPDSIKWFRGDRDVAG